MIKAQVCGVKLMMDGDVRITINIPQERVPNDIITWGFEDVVIVTKVDIGCNPNMGQDLSKALNESN